MLPACVVRLNFDSTYLFTSRVFESPADLELPHRAHGQRRGRRGASGARAVGADAARASAVPGSWISPGGVISNGGASRRTMLTSLGGHLKTTVDNYFR